jgi:hypothetical protein
VVVFTVTIVIWNCDGKDCYGRDNSAFRYWFRALQKIFLKVKYVYTLWLLVKLRVISHFIERKFTNSDLYMYYCICHERKEYVPCTWRKFYSILQLKLRFSLKKMWSHVISQLQSIKNDQTFRSVFSKEILFVLQVRVFLSPVGLFHTILSLRFI